MQVLDYSKNRNEGAIAITMRPSVATPRSRMGTVLRNLGSVVQGFCGTS